MSSGAVTAADEASSVLPLQADVCSGHSLAWPSLRLGCLLGLQPGWDWEGQVAENGRWVVHSLSITLQA